MLHITETTEYYGPSKELKEKFNNLCMYAAAAKMLGQVELYEHIKEQYDSLSRQYNDLAKKNERGFFGQMWDNFTYRNRHVHKQGKLEDDSQFNDYCIWFSNREGKTLAHKILEELFKNK